MAQAGRETSIGIGEFLRKLREFYFAPPSNNLWTAEFRVSSGGAGTDSISKGGTVELWNNIRTAIANYGGYIGTNWSLDTASVQSDNNPAAYFSHFEGGNRMFLCNAVQLPAFGLNAQAGAGGSEITPYAGFLNVSPAKAVLGRTPPAQFSISFLDTNWSVLDLFIMPWIAAVAMQGLIRDESLPELTSDITVRQYAASSPYGKTSNTPEDTAITLLKEVTVVDAYPTNVSMPTYKYESGGGYGTQNMVSFNYADIRVKYNI